MSSTVASPVEGRPKRLPRNPWRILTTAEPWHSLLFMLVSFMLGVFWFVVLVTLIAVGVALSITWIGIPILAFAVVTWIGAARLERWRIGLMTGQVIPPPYRPLPAGGWWQRTRSRVSDWAVWRDLLYLALLFPIGVVQLFVAVFVLGLVGTLVTAPLYFWSVPGGITVDFLPGLDQVDTLPKALALAVIGAELAVPGAYMLIGATRAHVALARLLLGPSSTEQLEERVEVLTKSRSSVIDAQLAERRRIERDLHDGAQQRLVALAMDLGMAREKIKSNPEEAQQLVESSHEEAKRVLAELRELVRGIHPAVLSDRGLDAAISAIVGRASLPVNVDVQLNGRLPEPVEAAAYFVVLEALANITKHSRASEAWVAIRQLDGWLLVEVMDNGVGGVDASRGTGLLGLADRVAALDGRLTIDSPDGGPTRLRAEIPCAW